MCVCTHLSYIALSLRHEVPERLKASNTQAAGEVSCCASLLQSSNEPFMLQLQGPAGRRKRG